jgi:hypothetical protein
MLMKKEIMRELRDEVRGQYSLDDPLTEDVFALQDFLHLDLELWQAGKKEVTLSSGILEIPGSGTGTTVYSFRRAGATGGGSLAEYLHDATGSNVVTEFKYLIRPEQISAFSPSAPPNVPVRKAEPQESL